MSYEPSTPAVIAPWLIGAFLLWAFAHREPKREYRGWVNVEWECQCTRFPCTRYDDDLCIPYREVL